MAVEFLLTTLIVVAIPGTGGDLHPGSRSIARSSTERDGSSRLYARHHPAHGRGDTGVAALLHTSALAFQALKYLGVAYLLYMAWAMLKEKGALSVDVDAAPQMLELSALFMMFTLVVFAA